MSTQQEQANSSGEGDAGGSSGSGGPGGYKEIKFVVHGSGPASNRRATRACYACHSRKVRCSGGIPCTACIVAGRECTQDYKANVRIRKKPAESGIGDGGGPRRGSGGASGSGSGSGSSSLRPNASTLASDSDSRRGGFGTDSTMEAQPTPTFGDPSFSKLTSSPESRPSRPPPLPRIPSFPGVLSQPPPPDFISSPFPSPNSTQSNPYQQLYHNPPVFPPNNTSFPFSQTQTQNQTQSAPQLPTPDLGGAGDQNRSYTAQHGGANTYNIPSSTLPAPPTTSRPPTAPQHPPLPHKSSPHQEMGSGSKLEDSTTTSPRKVGAIPIRVPYFRYLGPTAIAPGFPFREWSVSLKKGHHTSRSRGGGTKEEGKRMSSALDSGDKSRSSGSSTLVRSSKIPRLASISSAPEADNNRKGSFPSELLDPTADTMNTPAQNSTAALENPRNSGASSIASSHLPTRSASSTNPSRSPSPPLPSLATSKQLIEIWFDKMGSCLPFLQKSELWSRIEEGTVSEVLLLSMAALAERLRPSTPTQNLAEIYANRAKHLVIPHLAIPSLDTVFALLLLAYHEFGEDRDSGLWSWCGLAIRMAVDLGLHKTFIPTGDNADTMADETSADLRRRVFWGVYCLDRLISSGTGRVCTLPDAEIEIDLPSADGLCTVQNEDGEPVVLLDPFPYLCKILRLLGKISDTFNRRPTIPHGSPNTMATANTEALQQLQHDLSQLHYELPTGLHFTVGNFKNYTQARQSQAFLLLHIWFQALIITTNHPSLVRSSAFASNHSIPTHLNGATGSLELSRSGYRSISDMISFSDLIDPDAFLCSPFASQPCFAAGWASLMDWRSAMESADTFPSNLPPASSAMESTLPGTNGNKKSSTMAIYGVIAQRSFYACAEALNRMQKKWKGVAWLVSTLESRAAQEADVDLTSKSKTEVSTRDAGIIRRVAALRDARDSVASSRGKRAQTPGVFGLSVTGTVNEPASGVLHVLQGSGHHASPDDRSTPSWGTQSPEQQGHLQLVDPALRHQGQLPSGAPFTDNNSFPNQIQDGSSSEGSITLSVPRSLGAPSSVSPQRLDTVLSGLFTLPGPVQEQLSPQSFSRLAETTELQMQVAEANGLTWEELMGLTNHGELALSHMTGGSGILEVPMHLPRAAMPYGMEGGMPNP